MANLDESSSKYSIRYVAMTTREALAQCGINLMTPNLDELERDIVLAEARVPVRVG